MKIQLIADPEYHDFFSNYLQSHPSVELVSHAAAIVLDASFLHPVEKLRSLGHREKTDSLLITNTLTTTATSVWAAIKETRVVGMPMLPYHFAAQKSVEFAVPFGAESAFGEVISLLETLGKSGEKVQDSIAGVFPRTLAMIVNEAAFALQEGVASAHDIDTSMKLGTNYPKGPLAWCDEIGAPVFVALLEALGREYGADRYKIASRLRLHAESGVSFHTA